MKLLLLVLTALVLIVLLRHLNHYRDERRCLRRPSDVWFSIDPFRQPPRRLLWFDSGEGRLRGWVLRH